MFARLPGHRLHVPGELDAPVTAAWAELPGRVGDPGRVVLLQVRTGLGKGGGGRGGSRPLQRRSVGLRLAEDSTLVGDAVRLLLLGPVPGVAEDWVHRRKRVVIGPAGGVQVSRELPENDSGVTDSGDDLVPVAGPAGDKRVQLLAVEAAEVVQQRQQVLGGVEGVGHAPQSPPRVHAGRMTGPKPRVYRGISSQERRIVLDLPFFDGTRGWLRDVCGPGTQPDFDRRRKMWTVARPHYWTVIEALADRFGEVTVIEDYSTQEKCTRSCTNARPDTVVTCECVCGGDMHGANIGVSPRAGWIEVGNELLVGTSYLRRTFVVRRRR